jgi:uncharacterized protein DUF1236
MKLVRTTLLSAAGVIVAFGLTAAQAQTPGSDVSPGGPPAAAPEMSGGGPGGGAPSGGTPDTKGDRQGATGAGPTTPEGGTAEKPGKAAGQTDQKEGSEPGSDQGKAGKSAKDTMPSEGKTSGKPTAEEPSATGKTTGTAETDEGKTGTTGKGETDATAKGESGKAGASAKIEPQQVQKVKTYFSSNRPSVKRVDRTEVSVSVGIALPGTIVLYDLPPDVIVVEGGCPIKYFVWGEDVVLVDSCTRHVVEIIVGVA